MTPITIDKKTRMKLIGDSITAGRGSSDCLFNGEFILSLDGRTYYRQTGKKCYASLLKEYVEKKYPGSEVINNGCNGLNSYQVCKFFELLLDPEDTIVLIMLGANNRKLPNGMNQLYHDLEKLVFRIKEWGGIPVILNSGISTAANERRKSRRYHMNQVQEITKKLAEDKGLRYIDLYSYFLDYVQKNHTTPEELLLPNLTGSDYDLPEKEEDYSLLDWNRVPDGLHPPDSVHRMMADYIISSLGI